MSSVEEFTEHLFSKSPASQGSIGLNFDVESPSELFEVLLLIMTNGMKRWYGPRINIADISAEKMRLLQEYFLSFNLILHVDKAEAPGVYAIDNKEYMSLNKLEEMTFKVVAHNNIFTIRFSFVPGFVPCWDE